MNEKGIRSNKQWRISTIFLKGIKQILVLKSEIMYLNYNFWVYLLKRFSKFFSDYTAFIPVFKNIKNIEFLFLVAHSKTKF